jgi:hypothetical protein
MTDEIQRRIVRRSMTDRLIAAAEAVKDDVCGVLCPSTWKTADGRPPCHPKCAEFRAALDQIKNTKFVGS